MSTLIRPATTPADFDAYAALVREYVAWSRERYGDEAAFIEQVFGHQSLAREIDALASAYAPPAGRAFLAEDGREVVGGGAYRRLADGSCEMKRLFVRSTRQGRGTGRRLCAALIGAARADGFERMKLDTGKRLTEAIALYASVGFRPVTPYHDYPPALLEHLVFMELDLCPVSGGAPGRPEGADAPQPD